MTVDDQTCPALDRRVRDRRDALGRFGLAFALMAGLAAGTDIAWAQQAARQACGADYKSFCSGVQPGGGRIIACLKQNQDKLSQACKAVLAKSR